MGTLRLTPREEQLLKLANRQFGLLRTSDLLAAGLTDDQLQTRREACRLTRVHAGVYAFGHTALRDEGHWLAAQWACGPSATLSHHSAAGYHGWPVEPDGDVHVSVTGTIRSRTGLRVHRVATLDRADVFRPSPFRVTTIPRTLVDLADVLAWPEFRALADSLPRLHVAGIRAAQERAPGRAGRGLVSRLVEADDAHTKSEFERRFRRFLKAHRLPLPDDLNATVAGHTADCVYRTEPRLVVELDGRAFHERRAQMRADRHRDADYQLAGFRILRLVWDDLHPDEAARTARRVARMLGPAAA
jgi:very-short-patch-repair endonuclease